MAPIDVEAFDDYLKSVVRLDKKNDKNRKSVVRVIKKLVSGKGVTHKNRPGETFLAGHVLQLSDDLEAIQTQAAEWLPFRKGDPNIKDKGHGWALNHPLMWLIGFKKHLAGDRKRKAIEPDPMDNAMGVLKMKLKTAVDDGSITQQESEAKKRQILGFIDQELATINVADEVAPPPVPVPVEEGEH